MPSSAPRPTQPTTPPAGPEKNVLTGSLRTAPGVTAPPFDCITRGAMPDAEIGDAALEALEIAVHDRHQARVDRRRRKALELAKFGQHVGRRAQIDVGPELLHEFARALRARDSRRSAACRSRPLRRLFSRSTATAWRTSFSSSGVTSVPSCAMRSGDFDAAVARRGRHRLQHVEIEIMRPALARELEDVAEARPS